MAKKKAAGKTRQQKRTAGKRLGTKISDGQKVTSGSVIVRQRGSKFHPGEGTKLGRDFTLFATVDGIVKYGKKLGKKVISVVSK